MVQTENFFNCGWCLFGHDDQIADWVGQTLPAAQRTVTDPQFADWLRCQGTWFAGVNALANDASGAVVDGAPLKGSVLNFVRKTLRLEHLELDRGQVSVCYPGYPKPMDGESDSAFSFRLNRDAAHVDGLHRVDPGRQRFVKECHTFILGIPMVEASPDAAPLVVWKGSHNIMRKAFLRALQDKAPRDWESVNLTEVYQDARREVFETCERIEVPAKPGEAYLVHRLALHGVAPWGKDAVAGPDGRMIVYFRPHLNDPARWLTDP